MLTHPLVHTVWLLLLLHVSGNAFKLFKGDPELKEGDVRLFGSTNASEGRVEVYHDGKWGTVCDDGWDMAEAQVVCRQLHFSGAKSIVTGNNYGQATGPIWLDDINCKGTENHLLTCSHKGWGITDCTHKEDVGVICESNNMTNSDATRSLDHSFSLSDDLKNIFESGHGCDFLILVKSATGNRQEDGTMEMTETTVCAHKIILSQFPLFNASEGISNITIHVSQSCLPYFTSFIRYIYTRKIDVTFSSVQCLHWMASKFGVKKLMEDAGTLFSKFLPEDTSFYSQLSLYKYAEETGDLVLQENCIQYLAWNYQNLTRSPAWTQLPVELFGALLARSDLVVPDEYFLLQSTESWITEKGHSISSELQADLLSHIRFPMIPAEKLFALESSSLYSTHKNMYRENIMRAFQFNVLLFTNLSSNPKFQKDDDDFQPRIYTAEPWSIAFSTMSTSSQYYPSYYSGRQVSPKYFHTPVHNSLIFRDSKIQWEAQVFRNRYDCSNRGIRCESLPMARLTPQNQLSQQKNVHFHNRLLLMCQGNYISQVQDFKANLANIAVNGTDYPCPDNLYTYHFVVRPVYF
ncbi:galectin-3-binding protein A [Mastacembelus armatus]|uniref:Galectin 3 binding protein, tandem duplicate 3 n=1 Tax=Mastacembelus armatus TaxID=205130 RepID=A0A3Q3MVZ1_9TELE|nr:galectin-3-binding protein [Mastacembelus armatus]